MPDATRTRSQTRAKIVDAAAQLLRDEGPAAVTTRGVAERAGVQAPTIYRLFGDKDGLLNAIAEHVMATYVAAKACIVEAASAEGVDPIEDLRAGWRMQIDFGLANPALSGLLSDPARALRSPAAQSGRHILQARVHRVALSGRLCVSEERAVDLIRAAGTGAVLTLLSTPHGQRDPGLSDDLFDAVLRRIVTDAPEDPEREHAASVVAVRAIAPQLHMLSGAERDLLGEWLDRVIDAQE